MINTAASPWRSKLAAYTPGAIVAFTIAGAAQFLSEHYGAPTMLFALLIGMAFNFLSDDEKCRPGIAFSSSTLLKIGVALLGARVTLEQITSLGVKPLIMAPVLIVLTILSGLVLSRIFSKSGSFGLLTGGAVAICGASAALAISSVLPKSAQSERDTLFTVVAVTSLSTIAMIVYPVLFSLLSFTDAQIGVLLGATIHDVAQVVGAGYAVSDEAGDVATYVKLLRVACLPIVILALAITANRGGEKGVGQFPWFALAFAAILIVNSLGAIPETIRHGMEVLSRALLVGAIAALGMKTSLKDLAALGPSHIGVVILETIFLCLAAVAVVYFI